MGRSKNRKKVRSGSYTKQALQWYIKDRHNYNLFCTYRYERWCGYLNYNFELIESIPVTAQLCCINYGEWCAVIKYYEQQFQYDTSHLSSHQLYHLKKLLKKYRQYDQKYIDKANVPDKFAEYCLNNMCYNIHLLELTEDRYDVVEYFRLTLPERRSLSYNREKEWKEIWEEAETERKED